MKSFSQLFFLPILALLHVSPNLCCAQQIIPLAGNIVAHNLGGVNILFSVKVLLDKQSAIPDSAFFRFYYSPKTGYYPLYDVTLNPDSTVTAEYQAFFRQNGNMRLDFKFSEDTVLVGDSSSLINFYLSYTSGSLFYLPDGGPETFIGSIYHHPDEIVRGNAFISFSSQDSLKNWGEGLVYTMDNIELDRTVSLQDGTSDFIYHCDTCRSHTTGFFYEYGDWVYEIFSIHFRADSSLKGRFDFDTTHLHPSGFIVYELDENDTFDIQFKYIDSTAQEVQVLSYSTLTRFGTDISGVSSFNSGDTTFVRCKHYMPAELRKHLPGSAIFHIVVKLNNGRTVTRMISMILKNRNSELTGLKEHVKNEPLVIYPNPASESINVNLKGNYQIIDISGRQILEGYTDGKILLGEIKPGLYTLRIKDNIQAVRFVKM